MSLPRLACIVPFADEERNLPAMLASISAQSVDNERLFVIAVDNASTDRGPAIVEDWFTASGIAGIVVRAAVRSIPLALNTGLAHARDGDVVVRLDAHTLYDKHYLRTIDDSLRALPDAWCVGGANTPVGGSDFRSSLVEALYTNPMGLGPAAYRSRALNDRARPVASVYLGAWRPGVLQQLGGFDERWRANEDSELAARIHEAGGTVYRIPADCVRMEGRSAIAIVRQWMRYGFWRAQTLKAHPRSLHARQLAPAAALLTATGLLFTPLRAVLAGLYLLYAAAVVAARQQHERPDVTAACLVFFPLVHGGFALGTLAGALATPKTLTRNEPRSS